MCVVRLLGLALFVFLSLAVVTDSKGCGGGGGRSGGGDYGGVNPSTDKGGHIFPGSHSELPIPADLFTKPFVLVFMATKKLVWTNLVGHVT